MEFQFVAPGTKYDRSRYIGEICTTAGKAHMVNDHETGPCYLGGVTHADGLIKSDLDDLYRAACILRDRQGLPKGKHVVVVRELVIRPRP